MEFNGKWSRNLAYAIGLLATDGCIGRDGTYIDFTSKDIEQIENLKNCLVIKTKIGKKKSGSGFISNRIQIRNREFHSFLLNIGITPAKSKTIGKLKIPETFFFDFLRGVFDGDGSVYSYYDKRWKKSFMFYINFASASLDFIKWIRKEINNRVGISGCLTIAKGYSTYQLKYAKRDSLKIIRRMYKNEKVVCLSRKKLKINKILDIVNLVRV